MERETPPGLLGQSLTVQSLAGYSAAVEWALRAGSSLLRVMCGLVHCQTQDAWGV